eukprot:Colp12_sorted_trinity150504_noHs@31374
MATVETATPSEAKLAPAVGEYWLTSVPAMVGMGLLYIVYINAFQAFMKNRQPLKLKGLSVFHNFFMSAASAYMMWGMLKTVLGNWSQQNWNMDCMFCDPQNSLSQGGDFYFHLFYLSKFYEYIDTGFLIVRKKPVIFLHSFHHFITPSIVWSAWLFPVASNWIGPITNAFVHVVMYAYYGLAEFGLSRSLGKYVTWIQLTQFMGNLFLFVFVGLRIFECKGNPAAWCWIYVQYIGFLILFFRFYFNRQKKMKASKSE